MQDAALVLRLHTLLQFRHCYLQLYVVQESDTFAQVSLFSPVFTVLRL